MTTGQVHNHVCPECLIEWDHEAPNCYLDVESRCEDCLVEQIYWEKESFTTLRFCLQGNSTREPTSTERLLMYIGGFKSIRDMDLHYSARSEVSKRDDVSRDKPNRMEESGPNAPPSTESANVAVQFSTDLDEFNKAVKYLLARGSKREKNRLESVDLNAQASQVELVISGTSSAFPAMVQRSGYARVPLPVFDRMSRSIRILREDSIGVSIEPGVIRVAKLAFSHPEISLRLMSTRIADLPIDASLPDVLALLGHFRPEELEDSGLASRVLDAQEQATKLIDRATEILSPLAIEREELSRFISEKISHRHKKRKSES